ncbi:hypothetical protein Dimus_014278 [Dionaea muscipula]
MVSPGFNKKQLGYNYPKKCWQQLPGTKRKETIDAVLQNPKGTATESDIVPHEPEWVISIRKKLAEARQIEASSSWGKLSIYRVPHSLRDPAHKKSYTPQVVSLGPYHHGKSSVLKEMEEHKWRALDHILKRHDQDINIYLNAMKELEEEARTCYERPVSCSSEEFVQMMVLDGCFMLELFIGADEGGFDSLGYAENDPVFSLRSTIISIQRDMIMLENQIPLFVLDKLLNLQPGMSDRKSVAQLALEFFKPLMPTGPMPSSTDPLSDESDLNCLNINLTDPTSDQSGLHCLDVFRRSLVDKRFQPVSRPRDKILQLLIHYMTDGRRQQLIHCVIDLKNAGVKFMMKKTDRFWDIKFENGVLEIPRMLVHDGTKSLFFNLIAFEQCHLDSMDHIITSYAIFMDNLINSAEDVSHLHSCGIIEHWLGSDKEVANLFNCLCQEVVFDNDNSSMSELSEKINAYYEKKWNTWIADFSHKHLKNPWAIISLVAAVILLLLTFAQSFYAVYAYYKPPNS